MSTCRVVGGLWVRLGKIKCATKALACALACSSFNFAKGWHFVCRFTVCLLLVLSFSTLAPNGSRLAEVAGFSALPYQLATKVKCMQPSSN